MLFAHAPAMRAYLTFVVLLSACGARSELLGVEAPGDAGVDAPVRDDGGTIDSGVDAPLLDVGVDGPAAECPKDPPLTGSACGEVGAVCTYRRGKIGPCSDASASDQVVSRCEKDGWLEIARCIDPTACPPVMPTEGQSCAPLGLDCFYSAPTCATGAIFQCESSHWHATNDCGARAKETACVLTPTLDGDARVLLDTKGTVADRATLGAAGTQVMAAYTLTPMLGGTESVAASVFQTAVPTTPTTLPFTGSGPFVGDSMPALDFVHDRFSLAYGARSTARVGAYFHSFVLDSGTWSPPGGLPTTPTLEVDVASVVAGGALHGWMVTRSALGDAKSGIGTLAVVFTDGRPRDTLALADERPTGRPDIPPLEHAWAKVARWKDGFVLAASVPASGDLFDDTGINVWFVADPSAITLEKHVRLAVGQTTGGDVVALADGTVVVGYQPSPSTLPRYPYELVSVQLDGTTKELPKIDVGVAESPGPLSLVPFDAGFVAAFSAVRPALPDYVPGFVTVSMRDATGAMIVSPILEDAPDLRTGVPLGVAFSAADRALHVAWTRAPEGPSASMQIVRQRFVCR